MKKSNFKFIRKMKPKTALIWFLFLVLFFTGTYQTYALISITSALSENGISFGKVNTDYSFSYDDSKSMSELPDMAGGC